MLPYLLVGELRMNRVQQLFIQQSIWIQALILTLVVTLVLFVVGLIMGKLRHFVIEGALRKSLLFM